MKKLFLYLGIVVAVLVSLLAVILLFFRGKKIKSADTEALYSVTYTVTEGTMKASIRGKFPKGCAWSVEKASALTTVEAGRQTGRRAEFVFTAQESGVEEVTFVLAGTGEVPDRRYELHSRFLVTGKLSFVVERSTHTELPEPVGEDAETYSYRVTAVNDTTFFVRVTHDPAQVWRCTKAAGTVTPEGLTDALGTMARASDGTHSDVTVVGEKTGASTLYLENDAGDTVELQFSTGSTGVTSLIGYRILSESAVRVTENTDYQKTYGEIAAQLRSLPEASGRVERWLSRDDNLTTFSVGVSEYELNNTAWTMCIAAIADETDFAGHDTPKSSVTVNGVTAHIFAGDYGVRSVWRVDGNTYLLESAYAAQETAEALTQSLLTVLAPEKTEAAEPPELTQEQTELLNEMLEQMAKVSGEVTPEQRKQLIGMLTQTADGIGGGT